MVRFVIIAAAAGAFVFGTAVAARAGDGAQVTRATLASFWVDQAMTCDETQVVNRNGRKETIHCTLPAPGGAAQVYDCGSNPGQAIWFSDFDGQQALACHITIAPNGTFNAWASY